MNNLAPVSVMLKFGFLAVMYLFLLWVARSALRDLRGNGAQVSALDRGAAQAGTVPADATGLHSASTLGPADLLGREAAPGRRARPGSRAGDDL